MDGIISCSLTLDEIKTGEAIKNLMKEKNITRKDIAYEMDMDVNTISHWTKGRNFPTVRHLVELASILDVGLDDLVVVKDKNLNLKLRGLKRK